MVDLRLDIWSDIACPWCYIGKRRLERALSLLKHTDLPITWHAFELNPAAPQREDTGGHYAERLAKKYGTSASQAQAMIDRVKELAKAEGLDFDFDIIRPGNTFDAHRLLRLARTHGIQSAVKERFMRGYFCEGQQVSDHETLERLAVEAGLDAQLVSEVLASNAYAVEVRQDETQARDLDINGVPFFVVNEHYGISGAQPPEVILDTLAQAQRASANASSPSDGAYCGPDGC
jgi:predicted DsbA family dithiol-disulfide isomerase